mgnify:CR=1 FL=1
MASVLAWASTTPTASSGQKNKHVPPAELRGLYAITDETLIPESEFVATVEQALRGGAAIIQYRDLTKWLTEPDSVYTHNEQARAAYQEILEQADTFHLGR